MLVAVLATPTAVLATDTTEVTGTVIEGYMFTAPSAVALGNMTPGTTATGNSTDGSLVGNNAAGYTVKGIDQNTEVTKGYMLIEGTGNLTDPQYILTNKLYMGPTAAVPYTADVLTTFLDESAPGTYSVPFYVSQEVTYADPVADGYTITITFTVTPKTP